MQTENGKYHLALLENPKNTNGKVTKNTEVEVKLPAVKKRDKKRKKLKCEPPTRCSVKKKASNGDYDSAMVSCGNHEAKNCAACPQGHGAGRCNGDCVWKDDQCQNGPTTVASTVPTTVPITVPTLPTSVPTTAPIAVPTNCGRGKYQMLPLDFVAHPCPPGTEITKEPECRAAAGYINTMGLLTKFDGYYPYNCRPGVTSHCHCVKNVKNGANGNPAGTGHVYWTDYTPLNRGWHRAICRQC